MTEISGFSTDIGIGMFYFQWKPSASHPGEVIHLFSKKYVQTFPHSSVFLQRIFVSLSHSCLIVS